MVMRLTGKPRLYDAVRVLLAVFVVEAGIGLLETLTSFRWPVSRYSSWAETFGRTNDYGILSQVPFVKRYVDSSPTGFAWNSNNFSVVMSLFFPFFLIHRNQKVAVAGGLLILFLILMAGSRIAFLACAIISLVALAVEGRWLKWRAITVFLAVITLSTGFFTLRPTGIAKIDEIYIVKGSRPIYDKQFKLQTEYSRATRIELFNDGLEALGSTRGLGLGGGNFEAYRNGKAAPGEKVVTSLHNFWFEILVEGGVAFAALFYAWWLFLARSLYRAGQACADDRFRYLLNGTLLAMVIFGISAVSMSGAVYFLPMYLLLGLVVSILKIDRDHESRVEGPAAG
jgi:teichuronic acid biosynthesis protein TuaE